MYKFIENYSLSYILYIKADYEVGDLGFDPLNFMPTTKQVVEIFKIASVCRITDDLYSVHRVLTTNVLGNSRTDDWR